MADIHMSDARAVIMRAIRDIGVENSTGLAQMAAIVEQVGKKRVAIQIMLSRLYKAGLVQKPLGWGTWKLSDSGLAALEAYDAK